MAKPTFRKIIDSTKAEPRVCGGAMFAGESHEWQATISGIIVPYTCADCDARVWLTFDVWADARDEVECAEQIWATPSLNLPFGA